MSDQMTARLGQALAKTGGAMLTYGVFLGGVGLLYCSTDCFVEKIRQKKDYWNGFSGGLAAGLAVGMKTKSLSVGVGSGFAMGALSVLVDASGHSLYGEGLLPDDGSIPRRKKYSPTVRVDG